VKGSIIHDLPRYDRFLGGKGTLEIGYPWLSVGAIVALEQVIFRVDGVNLPPKRVLELGSGGSTIFFAKRAEHVVSIETDRGWAPRTAEALERNGLAGKVELVVRTNPESERYVAALPDRSFDLLLVDHAADGTVVGRGARHAFSRLPLALIGLPKLKPTGWLVVDNWSLHGMQDFNYSGWRIFRFDDLRYSGTGTLIARQDPR
jgi:hypothetical protein